MSTAPAQDGVSADAVDGATVLAQDAAAARARCASPVFRGGVFVPGRARTCIRRGSRSACASGCWPAAPGSTRAAARSAMRPVPEGVAVATRGRARARAHGRVRDQRRDAARCAPLRNRLTVSSSHIVCTEPVPDVIDALGWRGGESISDGRALLHYMRTTRDDRIVFGWAGGRMAAGARPGGRMEVDHDVVAQVRADLVRFFPAARRPPDRARLGRADRRLPHPPPRDRRPARAAGVGRVRLHRQRRRARRTCSAARWRRSRSTGATPVTRLPFVDPPPRARAARAAADRRRRRDPPRARAQGGGRGGRPRAGPGVGRARGAAAACSGCTSCADAQTQVWTQRSPSCRHRAAARLG